MNYVLDTNHWSHVQRRTASVVARAAAHSAQTSLFMSVISQGELLAGVESLPDGARKADLRRLYVDVVRASAGVIEIDTRIAERYAIVAAQLKRAGKPIGANDIWIGATALVHDLVLATNDAHFKSIEGLHVEDWTTAHAS